MNRAMDLNTERAKYITAVVLYGTIGLFLRHVKLASEIVAMCRGILGSLFILTYLRMRGRRLDKEAIRKNLKWLLIAGIGLGLNWIFLFAAYNKTTVAIASLCNYMAPVIVILLAPLVLHERLDKRKMVCVGAAFTGIVLVSGVLTGSAGNLPGTLLGLAAAACFVVIVLCNRKLKDIDALDRSVVQLALSAVTILPYVLIRNAGSALQPDLKSVLVVLMLGIVHTGFAYCLYFSGMGRLPVQTVAILGYLEPVVSVLCSVVFLNEHMGVPGWIGAALVIGAAIASETMRQKDAPDPKNESHDTFDA
ncbi:MAG: EamA family transporter [Lachnospiraceae bacterium]|nr:EamA family transporter [Lachnospiraceae bacterium]